MDPVRNPFSPGAGAPPPALAGRDHILQQARVLLARALLGRHGKSLLLVGLRGVGKTVLLNEMQWRAELAGYKTVSIEALDTRPLVELLAPQLRKVLYSLDRMEGFSQKVREALYALKSFLAGINLSIGSVDIGVDPDVVRGVADSGDLEADLPDLFEAIGAAAAERGQGVALFIDELQYLRAAELSALIMAMHRMAQKRLPLVLLGAGLPQLPALAGDSKTYAERLFDFQSLGALAPEYAAQALQDPVREQGADFSPAAIDEIYRLTRGYPYYLQEWGSHCWNLATLPQFDLGLIQRASERAVSALDKSFFRVRFDRLTPREKDYLRALASLGSEPQRSGDIARVLGKRVNALGPLREGLIRKGMLFSPAHGDTAFTVPLFDAFLLRVMPE